jgi:hypothetical protein
MHQEKQPRERPRIPSMSPVILPDTVTRSECAGAALKANCAAYRRGSVPRPTGRPPRPPASARSCSVRPALLTTPSDITRRTPGLPAHPDILNSPSPPHCPVSPFPTRSCPHPVMLKTHAGGPAPARHENRLVEGPYVQTFSPQKRSISPVFRAQTRRNGHPPRRSGSQGQGGRTGHSTLDGLLEMIACQRPDAPILL